VVRESRPNRSELRVVQGAIGPGHLRPEVFEVPFEDPAARALRDAMTAEMRLRHWDRFTRRGMGVPGMEVTADQALWTGVARHVDGLPVGHVVLREPLDGRPNAVEVKRMYVAPSHRGAGVANALLDAVDQAASRLGSREVVLQTGDRQPEAVRLYERAGYHPIPVFSPYEVLTHSRCFAKTLPVVRPAGGR
jgi:GNAT superfamily N-acetyltransferase